MRRLRLLAALLAGGVAVCPAAGADAAGGEPPPAGLRDLVREGDDVIWGVAPNYQNCGPYRFESGHWRAVVTVGMPAKCRPLCLKQRADGAVVCLWENGGDRRAFSVHHGRESIAAGTVAFPASQTAYAQSQRLFADSKNNVWYTGPGPAICRLSSDGHVDCPHIIQPEECLARGRPRPGNAGPADWNTVSAVEDAQGRVWFYTDGEVYNSASLNGVLVFDGDTFSSHEILLDGKPPRVDLLVPKDSGHLWAGTWDQGLCILDTATFALERVPDQPAEARSAQVIFRRGEDWFFVCGPVGYGRADPLWRLRAGRWEKVIANVDANPFARNRGESRLWVRAAAGNYLGSAGSGLWFVPDEGPPARLDWRQGFPLASPCGLVPLSPAAETWVAVDDNGAGWVGNPAGLLAGTAAQENPRLRCAPAAEALAHDARRHLWGGFPERAGSLDEWDGERWTAHDLPPEMVPPEGYRTVMGVDGLQRVWMRAEWGPKRRVLIYDPAQDQWQSFDEFEKALEVQAPRGRLAAPPWQQNIYDVAQFGPRGQICYFSRQSKLAWFDGQQWHSWSRDEVAGKGSTLYFDGPPFFGADGKLRVNLNQQTYEYAGDNGWRRASAHEAGYADSAARAAASMRPEAPPGAVTRTPDSAAWDEDGIYWFTWQGKLFRCRAGLCAAVFQPGEAQPFIDRRRLASAFSDARGNAFLYTDERREYVILAPPGPPPRTSLELAARPDAPADQVVVRLRSDAGKVAGQDRFEWRLDGGPWQKLAVDEPTPSVTLDGMPGGAHHFEARSFDAALQTDAAPAVLSFDVRIDPQVQIDGYVAQLGDPDYARREAAVAALGRQPELATAALQTARGGADESLRWWIDAALQQIANAKRPLPTKPDVAP